MNKPNIADTLPDFFRLAFNQAGGLYIPLITVMMIQVRTFPPNEAKASTEIVMVSLMICMVIMTIQGVLPFVSWHNYQAITFFHD